MIKRFGLFFVAMVSVLLLTSEARAELREHAVSVSPFVGGYTFQGDTDLRARPVYGLRLGYNLTTRFALEGVIEYVRTKTRGGSVGLNHYTAHGDLIYRMLPDSRIVPFLAGGVGRTLENPDTGSTGTHLAANYGGGLMIFMTDSVALRGDVRHVIVFDSEKRNDVEYTGGLTFFFGGREKAVPSVPAPVAAKPKPSDADGDGVVDSADKCPGTPAGVRVDKEGCPLDGDKDGVADYLDRCPDTPAGASVDPNGCPLDTDRDGVPDYIDKCPNTPAGAPVDKDGCPKLAKKVSIALKVQFDTNKASIKPEYFSEVEKVAEFMKSYPNTRAEIEGHTDSVGSARYNKALSQKRAENVRKALIDLGIDASRLTAVGYGFGRPVAGNDTPQGREKNRRVVATMTAVEKPK